MISTRVVPELMKEYGGAVRTRMMDYLPDAEPRKYLYDLVGDYPRRGGRGLRPTLCIATARAFGSNPERALLTAVSIELMHNAMLIHDDVEDESEQRRGQPALHIKADVPLAINAGDMLALLAMKPLLDNRAVVGREMSMLLLEETIRMARESAEGQAMELGWRADNAMHITEADYLEMVLKKTCWLATIHPTRTGALIGAGRRVPLDPLIRFGFFVGAAFQVQDDLLNLTGDATAYGKELGGDIYEGKRTLMLIHLIENSTPEERERVRALMALPRDDRPLEEISWVRDAMDTYGCIEYARQVAHGLAGAAAHEFTKLYGALPESRDKDFIRALPAWVIARN